MPSSSSSSMPSCSFCVRRPTWLTTGSRRPRPRLIWRPPGDSFSKPVAAPIGRANQASYQGVGPTSKSNASWDTGVGSDVQVECKLAHLSGSDVQVECKLAHSSGSDVQVECKLAHSSGAAGSLPSSVSKRPHTDDFIVF